jgi:predicted RNase H-like nuclease (RuvC/YqgF family)
MVEHGDYGERLAALEAQLESVIDAQADIKAYMIRLEAKLDAYQTNYVPRQELNEMFRSRDEKIARLEDELKTRRQNWPTWIGIAASAAVSVWAALHK